MTEEEYEAAEAQKAIRYAIEEIRRLTTEWSYVENKLHGPLEDRYDEIMENLETISELCLGE